MTEIPEQVLNMVNGVVTMATDGHTSSYAASQNLEATQTAFKYGRTAALDNFQLSHGGRQLLTEYDKTLTSVLQHRIDTKVDEAQAALNKCYKLLG